MFNLLIFYYILNYLNSCYNENKNNDNINIIEQLKKNNIIEKSNEKRNIIISDNNEYIILKIIKKIFNIIKF